jgi:hypothetical protein
LHLLLHIHLATSAVFAVFASRSAHLWPPAVAAQVLHPPKLTVAFEHPAQPESSGAHCLGAVAFAVLLWISQTPSRRFLTAAEAVEAQNLERP